MSTSVENKRLKLKVLENLGCGLSVASLLSKLDISFEKLCEVATDGEVYNELKKWYKKYDFTYVPNKPLKTKKKTKDSEVESDKEVTKDVSEGQQVSRE